MGTLIWLLVIAVDVFALYNIWTSKEDTVPKVIWTIVILVLPIIGAIIWYFAGPKTANS